MQENNDFTRKWDRYYSEYIRAHKKEEKDIFTLTNEAIAHCMEKLGLKENTR